MHSRSCLACTTSFEITLNDLTFYESISVPEPLYCPDCRQQRRYSWRNSRNLYRRTCDLCQKSIVTIYHPDAPYTVYCSPCFWGDEWDAREYAQSIDFTRPFFEQFKELQLKVPRIALLSKASVNSEYTNHATNNKDTYLSFACVGCENVLYSYCIIPGRDCVDCHWVQEGTSDNLYECIHTYQSSKCQYSMWLQNCVECLYSFDLRNCMNCFMCSNLRNKSYCIRNVQYTREEYFKKITELKLDSHQSRKTLYNEWRDMIQNKAVHKAHVIEQSIDSTGNALFNTKNIYNSFEIDHSENSSECIVGPSVKDSADCYHFYNIEKCYDSHAILNISNSLFCHLCYDDSFLTYCDSCHNSNNLFGCVGIRKGDYCILNTQYSKEQYQKLEKELVAHMQNTGEWGQFFPPALSPFGYNETQGNVYMPMTKEEALVKGFNWQDDLRVLREQGSIAMDDLPDSISQTTDTIIKEKLTCESCERNYNIIPRELEFYHTNTIPVPRLCPSCRYMRRVNLRPPRKLFDRTCANSNCLTPDTVFFSPFDPASSKSPVRVFCESCYKQEIV